MLKIILFLNKGWTSTFMSRLVKRTARNPIRLSYCWCIDTVVEVASKHLWWHSVKRIKV